MRIIFGLELDDEVFPRPKTEGGVFVAGPKRLLNLLETWLGLSGRRERIEHLRVEEFRQVLTQFLTENPDAFFKPSFDADPLACAKALLDLRDELRLAGFGFQIVDEMPNRLATLCHIESKIDDQPNALTWGIAERFEAVLTQLDTEQTPLNELMVVEPLHLLPPQYQRLFQALSDQNVLIQRIGDPNIETILQSDLAIFKAFLFKNSKFSDKNIDLPQNLMFKNDGSLIVVSGRRETDLAAWFAKLFAQNPDFQPVLLLPERTRVLDNALVQEGLPALGLPSNSTARPTLQLLKLVTTFLWRPLDPYKILEFVTLAAKPLADDLAWLIARTLSARPGVRSDLWVYEINAYFEKLTERAKIESIDPQNIRKEYDFWFTRDTFDPERGAPRIKIIEIFDYLAHWATAENDRTDGKNASLGVLAEQSRRTKELLETLPPDEQTLTQLELERIIRTIYEATPVQPHPQELGSMPFVTKPTALVGDIPNLVWWNCVNTEPSYFFSRFYDHEIQFLANLGVQIQLPQQQNALQLWQREQAVLRTQNQLVLVMPNRINGAEVLPSALLSYLNACFDEKTIEKNMLQIGKSVENDHILRNFLHIPKKIELTKTHFEPPLPFIRLERPFAALLENREHETPTSLETLLYYPHQWVFSHKAKLNPSPILSVTSDNTLRGNLAHRFFEEIFKQDFYIWSKNDLETYIEQLANRENLLMREAAILLMYGQETERVRFLRTLKRAAWEVISLIKAENWAILGIEMDLKGRFDEKIIRGRADLVLQRGDELAVVDLKWSGAARRRDQIKSKEDLQLTLYSHLLTDDERLAQTAYFIIEPAKMIGRNQQPFQDAEIVEKDADNFAIQSEIWERMKQTFHWRMAQIEAGNIEIRAEHTISTLEETYSEENLLNLLEMKQRAAAFDHYRNLTADLR